MRRALLLFAVVAAAGCGGSEREIAALPTGVNAAAKGSFSTGIHLFGDTLDAEIDVIVDRAKLDPVRLRLKTAFAPYEQIGETEVERRDAGNLSRLTYRLHLRCLERGCITARLGTIIDPAGGAPRVFRFPPAEILYEAPDADKPRLETVARFPMLQSVSRINAQDPSQVYGFPFRGSVTPLPSLTYAMAPTTLAALLLAGAALLLVLPVTLVVRRLRRRPPDVVEAGPEASPLERAVALVEWSVTRSGEERRAALEALACELDGTPNGTLADDTRAAAWRPPFPTSDDADRIVNAVKEAYGLAG